MSKTTPQLSLLTTLLPTEDDALVAETQEPLLFDERFVSRPITPRLIADAVVEEDGAFRTLSLEGIEYKPTPRFMKGLALRMRVPVRVFDLFSPARGLP